jgi:hypothetical protein
MVTLYATGTIISHGYLFSDGSNCVSRIEEENNFSSSSLKTFSLAMFLLHKHSVSTALESVIVCSVKSVSGSYSESYKCSEGIVFLWNCV